MDVFTSSTSQPRWVSKSTQETLCVEDILSLQEVKQSMRDKLQALRDVLDAMENIQRGWFGIPEASNCLSKLFQEKPLTTHVFTALLPDDLHLKHIWAGDGLMHYAVETADEPQQPLVDLNLPLRALERIPEHRPRPLTTSSASHMDSVHSPLPQVIPSASPFNIHPDIKEWVSDYLLVPDMLGCYPVDYLVHDDYSYSGLSRFERPSFADPPTVMRDSVEEALRISRSTTSRLTHEGKLLPLTGRESHFPRPLFAIPSTLEEEGRRDRANPSMTVVNLEEDTQELPDILSLTLGTDPPNEFPPNAMSRGTSVTSVKSEGDSARSSSSSSYEGSYCYRDSRSASTDYGYYYVRRAFSLEEEEEEMRISGRRSFSPLGVLHDQPEMDEE